MIGAIAWVIGMTAAVSPLVWYAIPQIGGAIEARIFPIIENQRVDFVQRGPDLVGWVWRFDKRRRAAFVTTDAAIVTFDPADIVDASLLICDGHGPRYFRASRTTADPDASVRPLCVDISRARIRPDQQIRIHAKITYRPPHGLWPITYDLPPVVVGVIDSATANGIRTSDQMAPGDGHAKTDRMRASIP